MDVYDLTHPLTPQTPVHEGDAPVSLTRIRLHDPDGYQVTRISLGSHSGTHLDAPRHFFPNGATLDTFHADRFVRRGWVVDVRPPEVVAPGHTAGPQPSIESPQPPVLPPLPTLSAPQIVFTPGPAAAASQNPVSLVSAEEALAAGSPPMGTAHPDNVPRAPAPVPRVGPDLLADRLRDVEIEPGDFLLLWTGGALLADDALPLLVETGAGLVGTDAFSLDDAPYPAHTLLLARGVLLAENLANLDRIGPGPVMCAFLPLLWPESDGAPMRAVAWR
jgi:kynurenine formamidase